MKYGPNPDASTLVWEELVPGGAHWSGVVRRGTSLRLTDVRGGGNCAILFYNQEERLERYNMADTLKGQHTAYLTRGHVCYSDMGRVLCSITADTCGWHDPIGGVSDAALVKARFGESSYQQLRNDYHKNGYDSLINELGKYGMGKRDLMPPVNLFSKLLTDEEGNLRFVPDNSVAGDYVDLRFEMDALVVLSTSPHPMDPATVYQPGDIQLTCWRSGPVPADDPCRNHCPENQRAFHNTERLFPWDLAGVKS